MKYMWLRILVVIPVILMLSSCSRGMGDLYDWIEKQKSIPAPPIEALPEVKPYETFIYAAQDLRDPFMLPESAMATDEVVTDTQGPRPDMTRRRELLESYPLDSLEMVGTYFAEETLWALIKDPEGVVHRVLPGNYLGQNHGKILNIVEGRVSLVELLPDGLGGFQERETSVSVDEG